MKFKHSIEWRKGIVLSATFLLVATLSVSCKKKETQIGENTIDQDELFASGGIDTFQLITYTFKEDSTVTTNNTQTLLGSYNDPTFGEVNAEIYTQLFLEQLEPNFGDLNAIVVDSFVLGLQYTGRYGKKGPQTLEVFEITDADGIPDDSTFYSFSTLSTDPTDLVVPGQEVLEMDDDAVTIIDTIEVSSQLRIYLDTNLAKTFMQDAAAVPESFETNADFTDYFKGLHIRTANGAQSPGQGGIFYFDLAAANSKATIYYHLNGVAASFDFPLNGKANHFNHVDVDNSGTNVQNVIDNQTPGMQQFYAQAFTSRAAVEVPGISNISPDAVIHKAVMRIPVSHQTGTNYAPAGAVSVLRENPDNPGSYVAIGTALYSTASKAYTFDLRFHFQRIVNGEIDNTRLIIAPLFFNASADRIILNGAQTGNKMKPELRILYTEF